MKRWARPVLIMAVLLSLFDGAATYFAVSGGLAEEINPLSAFLQKNLGFDYWWAVQFFACIALVAIIMWFLTRGRFYWLVYLWFAAAIIVLIFNLWSFLQAGII